MASASYGLTHRVDSYNLVMLQYGHYADLWHDVRRAASWRDRLGYLFMPPDWQPGPDVGDRMALGLSERLKEPMLPEWTWPRG